MAQERTTDESDTDEVRGLALPIAFVGGLLGRLAFWAPVVFAFLFLAQASLKGLKPALAEEAEYPRRFVLSALTGLFLLLTWSILALIYYSIRDRS